MPSISTFVFYALGLVVIASALAVVLLKNIIHSALFLILSFAGVAGIYVLLNAEFLAAVQILVYVGAIAILIVFAVMLTRRGDMGASNLFNSIYPAAGMVAAALFVLIALFLGRMDWRISGGGVLENNNIEAIANSILGRFVLPFEAAAVLLLAAIIGAIVLARGVKGER